MLHGQQAEQHLVHEGENGGIRSNSQRQRSDGNRGKNRALAERSERKTKVLEKSTHEFALANLQVAGREINRLRQSVGDVRSRKRDVSSHFRAVLAWSPGLASAYSLYSAHARFPGLLARLATGLLRMLNHNRGLFRSAKCRQRQKHHTRPELHVQAAHRGAEVPGQIKRRDDVSEEVSECHSE